MQIDHDEAHPIVLAFPGQGSLGVAAGVPWRDHEAFDVVVQLSAHVDADLVHLLVDASADELVSTANAQLATFALSLCVLEATGLSKVAAYGVGHSLGEYTALVAAGYLDAIAGTKLVAVRGAAMLAAAEARPGGLVAVIGGDLGAARAACEVVPGLSVANLNGPGQIVLGGDDRSIAELEDRARELGFRRAIRLKVGGAFHTPLMAPALDALAPALAATTFTEGHAKVVANVDGVVHDHAADWPGLLARQLLEAVEFEACVHALPAGATIVECGAGSVLKGLISRIRDDVEVRSVSTPDDLTSIEVLP